MLGYCYRTALCEVHPLTHALTLIGNRYIGLAPELVSLARAGTSEDTELAQSALFALTMLIVRFGANPDGCVDASCFSVSLRVTRLCADSRKHVPLLALLHHSVRAISVLYSVFCH